jgi:hypothetical protein
MSSNVRLERLTYQLGNYRQVDRERASGAERALDRDPAAMGLHDVLNDGKPQSRAPQFTAAGAVDPVESLKQPRQVFGLDAAALIDDGNGDFQGRLLRDDADGAAWLAVFDGVVEEIDDSLLEQW